MHHDYRVAGGEERSAELLAQLAEEHLGEHVTWLRRDSTRLSGAAAARGLLAGGTNPGQVRDAVRESGADLVHAHNLFPTFGPAALKAARGAGAGVVVHLHNYRLVCAVAVAVRNGHDCTECHSGRPGPGLLHRCRGGLAESAAYAAGLPRWGKSVVDLADAVIVPSIAARTRLLEFGLQLRADRIHVVGGVAPEVVERSTAAKGRYALLVTRLAPEKDVRTAIDACRITGIPLVIAGEGPERDELMAYAGPRADHARIDDDIAVTLGPHARASLDGRPVLHGDTIFVGRASDVALRELRAGASLGLAPSLAHETFGLAALESMAAALPTAGSAVGALPELLGLDCTAAPGDAHGLAELVLRLAGNEAAGNAAAARARQLASPAVVAQRLGTAYAAARDLASTRRMYATPRR